MSTPTSLNELHLPGTVWIASDIHLGAQTPATTRAFLSFLALASEHADAVLLPGDIFEVWLGDDLATKNADPWLAPILEGLQDLARRRPLYLGRGNRDFLMGSALTDLLGATLLDERVCLHTSQGVVLLSHGDEYCVADKRYQRFRQVVRQPWLQGTFLKLPRALRQRIAYWARQRSQRQNQHKSTAIMDVYPQAIEQAFLRSGCPIIVHGHTHRPGHHRYCINGRSYQRVVLPDWDCDSSGPARGGWLSISKEGLTQHTLDGTQISLA